MGHAISYLVVTKKNQIMAEASEYAYCNGDRLEGSDEYHGQMKIIESMQPFESEEKAYDWLVEHYEPYHDMAVRFVDYEKKPPTKAMESIKEKIQDINSKLEAETHKRNTSAKAMRVEKLEQKKKEFVEKYKEAENRNKKKNGVYWLVKVEVHC